MDLFSQLSTAEMSTHYPGLIDSIAEDLNADKSAIVWGGQLEPPSIAARNLKDSIRTNLKAIAKNWRHPIGRLLGIPTMSSFGTITLGAATDLIANMAGKNGDLGDSLYDASDSKKEKIAQKVNSRTNLHRTTTDQAAVLQAIRSGKWDRSAKLQLENIIIGEMKSSSMAPLIMPGQKIAVVQMPLFTQYKANDIIAFDRDGKNIVHRVEYSFESNGKTYYVTEGINPETNEYVDEMIVPEEDVIGLVDLSEEAFARVQELYQLGKTPTVDVYGKPTKKSVQKVDLRTQLRNLLQSEDIYGAAKVFNKLKGISDLSSRAFNRKFSAELVQLKNILTNKIKNENYNRRQEQYRSEFKRELLKALNQNSPNQLKTIKSEYFELFKTIYNKKCQNLIKDNLFESIIEYYATKEFFYNEYKQLLEKSENAELLEVLKDCYAPEWNDESKQFQRLMWAVAFDCRNPYSGEKVSFEEFMSFNLHHYFTAMGHENKYICIDGHLIPLPSKNTVTIIDGKVVKIPGHTKIGNEIRLKGKGLAYFEQLREIIIKILNKEAPKGWNEENREEFKIYRNNNEVAMNLIIAAMVSNSDFITELGITRDGSGKFK